MYMEYILRFVLCQTQSCLNNLYYYPYCVRLVQVNTCEFVWNSEGRMSLTSVVLELLGLHLRQSLFSDVMVTAEKRGLRPCVYVRPSSVWVPEGLYFNTPPQRNVYSSLSVVSMQTQHRHQLPVLQPLQSFCEDVCGILSVGTYSKVISSASTRSRT
jgi:hypothetical protein